MRTKRCKSGDLPCVLVTDFSAERRKKRTSPTGGCFALFFTSKSNIRFRGILFLGGVL